VSTSKEQNNAALEAERVARVIGYRPGMSEVTLLIDGGLVPAWMNIGDTVHISEQARAQLAAPAGVHTVTADDVRGACQDAIEVFAEQPDADQCREVAEYMREVLLALIERRKAAAPSPAPASSDHSEDARHMVSDVVHVPRELPPFAQKVISKLERFEECASDDQDVDIGRHWLDLLTQLGLLNRVQRSPGLWEISQQGEDLLNGGRV
jgi:hypothetical protein